MTRRKLVPVLVLMAVSSVLISRQRSGSGFSPYVDENGYISRPLDYRENWTHLGTYFVLNESEAGHGMHQVYTRQRDLDAHNKTGRWPDGAVLVKEVMHTAQDRLTTGASNWATQPNVWFVVVKDQKGRFPNNPLWGEGWGWALFKADAPDVQAATSYKKDCLNCHLPAKETDFVYIQGYPAIRNSPEPAVKKPDQAAMAAPERLNFSGGSAERGAKVFAETCAFCHAVDSRERKIGPSLAVIAKESKLPSGKDSSPENILQQINNGGGGMPSFASSLQPGQKADLIAYLQGPQ